MVTHDMRSDLLTLRPLHIVDPLCSIKNKKMTKYLSIIILTIGISTFEMMTQFELKSEVKRIKSCSCKRF